MVIDGLPGGGAEKVVVTLVAGLLAAGHRVSLFSLRRVCEYALPAGVDYQVIEDRCRHPLRKLTELRRRARQLDNAVQVAERTGGEFDLVVSHLHKTDRIVRRCATLRADKTWFCLHGVFSASYLKHRRGVSRWLKVRKIQRVYQQRNVTGVSACVLEDLKSAFRVRLRREAVIANPFDIAAIKTLAQAPLTPPASEFILHVGRFHETKRHDRLLQAYALTNLTIPLVLLGKGSEEKTAALRAQAKALGIEQRVIFQGFSDNPYAWMARASLLVVSSDSEGFGNVLIESMLCGTPVVSTRCPGGPVSLLQGELARGLADLNPVSLANVMLEIYQQPPDLTQIDFTAFDTQRVCQQYLSLISADSAER
ncbi:glycosyltransferase [Pantoea sp. KPR_PJ]|uniref:glycosyltransferase n=1 Tax=Pantoea sp. KPR_PJ TaxID=2738375 RepID=UPI0035294F90